MHARGSVRCGHDQLPLLHEAATHWPARRVSAGPSWTPTEPVITSLDQFDQLAASRRARLRPVRASSPGPDRPLRRRRQDVREDRRARRHRRHRADAAESPSPLRPDVRPGRRRLHPLDLARRAAHPRGRLRKRRATGTAAWGRSSVTCSASSTSSPSPGSTRPTAGPVEHGHGEVAETRFSFGV